MPTFKKLTVMNKPRTNVMKTKQLRNMDMLEYCFPALQEDGQNQVSSFYNFSLNAETCKNSSPYVKAKLFNF